MATASPTSTSTTDSTFHRSRNTLVTLTATQSVGKFGALEIDDNADVTSFSEKPKGDGRWVSGGFFVLSPKVLLTFQATPPFGSAIRSKPSAANVRSPPTSITASGSPWTRCMIENFLKIFGTQVPLRGKYGELILAWPQNFSHRAHRL